MSHISLEQVDREGGLYGKDENKLNYFQGYSRAHEGGMRRSGGGPVGKHDPPTLATGCTGMSGDGGKKNDKDSNECLQARAGCARIHVGDVAPRDKESIR